MLTGHWINTMWCLLLLIQDNDIAGPRGKSLRHQLLQVKEGDIFQMLLSHERLDAKILDRIEDILSKDPQYKKSPPKKRALSKHQSDEFPERLPSATVRRLSLQVLHMPRSRSLQLNA